MIALKDGRAELHQWDTGRILTVDSDIDELHFAKTPMGRSLDVSVSDGEARIPDVLLQTPGDLHVWAFVGTPEDGYTKVSKVITVQPRNKPADYLFTPQEQLTLKDIADRVESLEKQIDGDSGKDITAESIKTALGYAPADAEDVSELSEAIAGLENKIPTTSGGMTAKALRLLEMILRNATYLPGNDQKDNITAFILEMQSGTGGDSEEEPDDGEGEETVYHTVQYVLTNAESTNSTTVIEHGKSFTTTLASDSPELTVSVIMSGTDITETAYNAETGVVTVSYVDGDLKITATGIESATITFSNNTGWMSIDADTVSWVFGSGATIRLFESNMAGGVYEMEWDATVLQYMDMVIYANRASFNDSGIVKILTSTATEPHTVSDLTGASVATYWMEMSEHKAHGNFKVGDGRVTVTIPDGYVPILAVRKNSSGVYDSAVVGTNDLFAAWLRNGGLTITQKGGVIDG